MPITYQAEPGLSALEFQKILEPPNVDCDNFVLRPVRLSVGHRKLAPYIYGSRLKAGRIDPSDGGGILS